MHVIPPEVKQTMIKISHIEDHVKEVNTYLLYNLDQVQWLQKDHYLAETCILDDLFDCKDPISCT